MAISPLARIARPATNFCLLLAVILTAFLLSGTTSPAPAISNLHVIKIQLNSTRIATVTSMPAGTSTFSTAASYTGTTTSRATTTTSRATTTTIRFVPTTSVIDTSSKVSKGSKDSVPKQQTTFNPPSSAATMGPVRRDEESEHQNSIFEKYKLRINHEAAQAEKGGALRSRTYITEREVTTLVGGDNANEGATVLVGYFGVCARNRTTIYSCTRSRRDVDKLEGATPELLKLAASIQGAISPIPPIIALTFQGMLVILACFVGFRSGTDLSTTLGQALALLAFAAFSLSLFTAILFQSASAVVYGTLSTSATMVASKGSSGIALAWAAVLFTGSGMCGIILLLLLGSFRQKAKGHTRELELVSRLFGNRDREHQPDIDIGHPLPVHRGESNASHRAERREFPPQKGNYF